MANTPISASHVDFSVCSLAWQDHPSQARLHPPHLDSYLAFEGFDVPLISAPPASSKHGNKQQGNPSDVKVSTKTYPKHCSTRDCGISIKGRSSTVQGTSHPCSTPGRSGAGSSTGRVSSHADHRLALCLSCENRLESQGTPEPPSVSPSSSTTSSMSDDASEDSLTDEDETNRLLSEIIAQMPCIETGLSIMATWADIREIFFPRCSSPDCNIVVNAFKLQLKYPHIPHMMHACTTTEQMVFLKQHLHLVPTGTLLVDVEGFLRHRESLQVMVETKHLVTTDPRSLGCSYTEETTFQTQGTTQRPVNVDRSKLAKHVMSAVVAPSNRKAQPGDAAASMESMVPLSMLPGLFPRYHRQLLLMATGFITGKSKRATRRCSPSEARVLNMWHQRSGGSNRKLVTSSDLLVKWSEVVVIVDPMAKHAARVCISQEQRQQQQQQQKQRQTGTTSSPAVSTAKQQAISSRASPAESVHKQDQVTTPSSFTTTAAATKSSSNTEVSSNPSTEPSVIQIHDPYYTPTTRELDTSKLDTTKTSIIYMPSTSMNGEHTSEIDLSGTGQSMITCCSKSCPFSEAYSSDTLTSSTPCTSNEAAPSTSESSCDSYSTSHYSADSNDTTAKPADESCSKKALHVHLPMPAMRALSIESFDSLNLPPQPKKAPYQTKLRKLKDTKHGQRRSERIASKKDVKKEEDSLPIDILTPETDEHVSRSASTAMACSELSSALSQHTPPPSSCQEIEGTGCSTPSKGFRNIADLFSVLSSEEVSHRSIQLASDEMSDAARKGVAAKPRGLGDLTSKGLELLRSNMPGLSLKPKPEVVPTPYKKEEKMLPVQNRIGKNRNKYPDLKVTAQKYSVDAVSPETPREEPNVINPLSVMDIMKSMDKTFSAYKNDPVELVKEKLKAPQNPTGYVNTDFVRINNKYEDVSDITRHSKSEPLPPLDANAVGKKVNFSTADISAILKHQSQSQRYSILDQKILTPKVLSRPKSDSQLKNLCSQSTSKSSEQSNMIISKTSVEANIKPRWNVMKILKTPKPPAKDSARGNEKDDFNKMKDRALLKQGSKPTVVTPSLNIEETNKSSESNVYAAQSSETRRVSPLCPPQSPTISLVSGESSQTSQIQDIQHLPSHANQEKIIQSKKRQRVGEPSTLDDVSASGSVEDNKSHVSTYWKGFPLGQPKDCLTNHRYGKSRYPIDHYTPPNSSTSHKKRQQQICKTQLLVPPQVVTVLPSYVSWKTNSPKVAPCSPKAGGSQGGAKGTGKQRKSKKKQQAIDMDAAIRQRILHTRSVSVDRYQFVKESSRFSAEKFYIPDTHIDAPPARNTVDHGDANQPPQTSKDAESTKTSNPGICGEIPAEDSNLSKTNTLCNGTEKKRTSISNGPFHDMVRLKAGVNAHHIRHMSDPGRVIDQDDPLKRLPLDQCMNRDPILLSNGRYMVWNPDREMWSIDNGRNNNCHDLNLASGLQLQIKSEKLDEHSVQKSLADSETEVLKKNRTDFESLLANTVMSFDILKKGLSKVKIEGNVNCNNNNDDEENTSYKNNIDTKYESGNKDPYKIVTDVEPVDKKVLLCKTLQNNFSLIRRISLNMCTCMDVVSYRRPARMHFKKFLKERYMHSRGQCPIHSQDDPTQFQHTSNRSDPGSKENIPLYKGSKRGKGKGRRKKQRGKTKGSASNSSSTSTCSSLDSVSFAATRAYLARCTFRHFKKEMITRYQAEHDGATMLPIDQQDNDDSSCVAHECPSSYEDISNISETSNYQDVSRMVSQSVTLPRDTFDDQNDDTEPCAEARCASLRLKLVKGKPNHNQNNLHQSREVLKDDNVISQQELFWQILSAQPKVEPPTTTVSASSELISADTVKDINDRKVANIMSSEIRYDEFYRSKDVKVSDHGVAHITAVGLSLPYVTDNGFKYLTIKQATRLLPSCSCPIARAVIKKHPTLDRTFCTWEQVSLFDNFLCTSRQPVRTGDLLVRLDTLIQCLGELDQSLRARHRTHPMKTSTGCLYLNRVLYD